MANETPKTATVSAADVAKDLSASVVLTKTDETKAAADVKVAEAAAPQVAVQAAALKVAAAEVNPVRNTIPKRNAAERAQDALTRTLDILKKATPGTADHYTAWKKLVEIIERSPKKAILDAIRAFFVENKNASFLNELNALQGTTNLEPAINIRVRLLYEIMNSIARGTATRRSISLETVRTVFKSDDFVNWVATSLPRT